MKLLMLGICMMGAFVVQAQASLGVSNYGRYAEFEQGSHFFLNTTMKDKAIAKKTAQFKFTFKDVDTKEPVTGVHLSWDMKNTQGNTQCDDSQSVLTLDKNRATFKARADNYSGTSVTVKPKNQYYYDYIVYLKRADNSGNADSVNGK